MKVRIPARFADYLFQSSSWTDKGSDPVAENAIAQVASVSPRKDGSRMVILTDEQRLYLRDFAGYFEAAAADDAGWDKDALADLNAARAAVRALSHG